MSPLTSKSVDSRNGKVHCRTYQGTNYSYNWSRNYSAPIKVLSEQYIKIKHPQVNVRPDLVTFCCFYKVIPIKVPFYTPHNERKSGRREHTTRKCKEQSRHLPMGVWARDLKSKDSSCNGGSKRYRKSAGNSTSYEFSLANIVVELLEGGNWKIDDLHCECGSHRSRCFLHSCTESSRDRES